MNYNTCFFNLNSFVSEVELFCTDDQGKESDNISLTEDVKSVSSECCVTKMPLVKCQFRMF